MYTLLHISDLHRSASEPASNAQLLDRMLADLERQQGEQPQISSPSALVVSGDLVLGARLGEANSRAILEEQYAEAESFLAALVDELLGGDRSRVVICPGNHDVDWNAAREAMEVVPDEQAPQRLWAALHALDSKYRWDWSKRELLVVSDPEQYARRFEPYGEFVGRFYAGTNVAIGAGPDEPVLVELFDRRVLVAAFSSCHGNDCFRQAGQIHPDSMSRHHLAARSGWAYELRIAVWHHNTAGPPQSEDYMSIEAIHSLMYGGYRLGMHGHQHHNEVVAHKVGVPGLHEMAVVSAGSLAAGQPELPRGQNRQYTVIELADDLNSARVHFREVELAEHFGPRYLNAFGGKSYVDLSWDAPISADRSALLNTSAEVLRAESELKNSAPRAALERLAALNLPLGVYGRKLVMDAAQALESWETALAILRDAENADEAVFLARANGSLGRDEQASAVLASAHNNGLIDDATHRVTTDWLDGRRSTRG